MDWDPVDNSVQSSVMECNTTTMENGDIAFALNNDELVAEHYQHIDEDSTVPRTTESGDEHPGLPVLPKFVASEEQHSPFMEEAEQSCLQPESKMPSDNSEEREYDCHTERQSLSGEDYNADDMKEGSNYGAHADHLLAGGGPQSSPNYELEGEDLDPSFQQPLPTADHYALDNENSDYEGAKSPALDGMGNGDLGNKLEKSRVETVDGSFSHHTEEKENAYPSRVEQSDSIYAARNSGKHSPRINKNSIQSPGGHFSDPGERSPASKPFEKRDELPSPPNIDKKPERSSPSRRRKRSSSHEKHDVGRKRASSGDRLSPTTRRKSPSGRTSHRDSQRRDHSPRKHLSRSPRRRESPRRKERSLSRSPVRRRDSSGHRRDRGGRSRSRSPPRGDRSRRSPRRRHSPRRRSPSPGHHSRRRSPRRPWSPPTNRNTGIGKPGKNLFVAGFSYVTNERDLEKKFSRFGRVTDVRIVRDKRSGDSRGFGFLSLEKDEDADAAIRALDQTEWNNRIILVEKSKTSVR